MSRSLEAMKEANTQGWERRQMDWAGLLEDLYARSEGNYLTWRRIASGQPERMKPWKIREHLKRNGLTRKLQIRQVLKGEVRTGDVQPVAWLTNDFEVDSGLARLERQKIASGENPLWDTWVRLKPSGFETREQRKAQEKYTENLRKTDDYERRAVDERHKLQEQLDSMGDPYTRQTYWLEDEINSLPPERKPGKIKALRRRHQVRRYEHTANNRIGREGWREWRVSITREKAGRTL